MSLLFSFIRVKIRERELIVSSRLDGYVIQSKLKTTRDSKKIRSESTVYYDYVKYDIIIFISREIKGKNVKNE